MRISDWISDVCSSDLTLEWATSSPPPDYNFAFTPVIHDLDAWYDMKKRGAQRPLNGYRDIHMPSNTGTGMILSGFCLVMGFALVRHIWWLVAQSFAATIVGAIYHTFNYKRDFDIPAARSEEHTSELQSLMRIPYAVFCLKKKKKKNYTIRKQEKQTNCNQNILHIKLKPKR